MSTPPFDNFFSDSPTQSSNTSTATSHIPGFGTTQTPSTQSQQNPWTGCYRPVLPNQEFNQYHYQPPPYQHQQYPPQQYPPPPYQHQQYPPQQYPPQQQPFQSFPVQEQHHPHQPQQQQEPEEPHQQEEVGEGSSSKKKKKAKKATSDRPVTKKAWTESEALTLSECYIHVSEDPAVSTNQDKDTFWYKILMMFNKKWGHMNRSKDSLTGKWDLIKKKVSKFHGIHQQLVSSNGGRASGTSDSDVFQAALREYHILQGHVFPHIQCWEFLKDKPKFHNPDPCVPGRRNRKRDTGMSMETPYNLDDDDEPEGDDSNELRRPPGRPRPGKSQKTTSSSATGNSSSSSFYEGINSKMAELNARKESTGAHKEMATQEFQRLARLKQRNLDYELLKLDTTNLPAAAAEHIEKQKAKIMENLANGYYDV